jgi:hypothetical protein
MSVELLLIERKALLEPLIANKPGLQFNGHEIGDGELILNANPSKGGACSRQPGELASHSQKNAAHVRRA